jgi:hypothetical protein
VRGFCFRVRDREESKRAVRYAERDEPLPKEVIARMSPKQIDMARAIFGEIAVRHLDHAQEIESFMEQRSAARKH